MVACIPRLPTTQHGEARQGPEQQKAEIDKTQAKHQDDIEARIFLTFVVVDTDLVKNQEEHPESDDRQHLLRPVHATQVNRAR